MECPAIVAEFQVVVVKTFKIICDKNSGAFALLSK